MSEHPIDKLRDDLKGIESLQDTPFSKLFHEARTTPHYRNTSNGYWHVAMTYRVVKGTVEFGNVVKARQGEHYRASDAWDGVISLPCKTFMSVETARQLLRDKLRKESRHCKRQA